MNNDLLHQASGRSSDWTDSDSEESLRGEVEEIRTQPTQNEELVDMIVCVGGHDGKIRDYVDAYDPVSDEWTSLANLPSKIFQHGSATTGNNIMYVAGGTPDGKFSNQLLRFDSQLNKWEEMASMSIARINHGMVMLDDFVYVVGGRTSDSVERYNPETNAWEELATTQPQSGNHSASVVAHGGYIYMAGGKEARNSLQRFDPRTRTWSDLASMPTNRYDCTACVLNGKLYVIGGRDCSTTAFSTVDCYDIHKNQWNACSPMLGPRECHGAAVMDDHIYVFGGQTGWRGYLKSVERYTPSTNRWEHVTDMSKTARYGLTCAGLKVPRSLLAKLLANASSGTPISVKRRRVTQE